MRISDWSSDVCSSDLDLEILRVQVGDLADIGRLLGERRAAVDRIDRRDRIAEAEIRLAFLHALDVGNAGARQGLDAAARDGLLEQIGRASCWESVCQYGQISVVDGLLKKKNI